MFYVFGKFVEELGCELGVCDIVKLVSNENFMGLGVWVLVVLDVVKFEFSCYLDGNGFMLK